MFRLQPPPTETRWLDLSQGVKVLVRPLDNPMVAAAGAYAERICRELLARQAEAMAVGAPIDGPDLLDADMRRGKIKALFDEALAKFGILAWEGVGESEDVPLELTPGRAELFGRSEMAAEFSSEYQKPLAALAAEGNASAPGPNGASAPGAITAPGAPPTAPIALVH